MYKYKWKQQQFSHVLNEHDQSVYFNSNKVINNPHNNNGLLWISGWREMWVRQDYLWTDRRRGVFIFCSVKSWATEGIWPGYDSTHEGAEGQLWVRKHIEMLSPICLFRRETMSGPVIECMSKPEAVKTCYHAHKATHSFSPLLNNVIVPLSTPSTIQFTLVPHGSCLPPNAPPYEFHLNTVSVSMTSFCQSTDFFFFFCQSTEHWKTHHLKSGSLKAVSKSSHNPTAHTEPVVFFSWQTKKLSCFGGSSLWFGTVTQDLKRVHILQSALVTV